MKSTVKLAHTKLWLRLSRLETHKHRGLSWAKEQSRGVLKLTNLYEINTIHTHTLAHPFPKAVGLRGPAG